MYKNIDKQEVILCNVSSSSALNKIKNSIARQHLSFVGRRGGSFLELKEFDWVLDSDLSFRILQGYVHHPSTTRGGTVLIIKDNIKHTEKVEYSTYEIQGRIVTLTTY